MGLKQNPRGKRDSERALNVFAHDPITQPMFNILLNMECTSLYPPILYKLKTQRKQVSMEVKQRIPGKKQKENMQRVDGVAAAKDKIGDGNNEGSENVRLEVEEAPSLGVDVVVDVKGKGVEENNEGIQDNSVLHDDGPHDDPIYVSSNSER
ncbi:hypothetical protein RYX36_021454 [Vicia faba]